MARSTIAPYRPRPPTQIQNAPLGSFNAAGAPKGRSVPLTSLDVRAPSQRRERFGEGLPPDVARMLNSLQDQVARANAILAKLPFAAGNLIQGVTFAAPGPTPVAHGLGRPWQGFMVVSPRFPTFQAGIFAAVLQATPALEAVQILIGNDDSPIVGDLWVW